MLYVNYIKRNNEYVRVVDLKTYRLKKGESFISKEDYYEQFEGKLFDGFTREVYDKLNDRVKLLLFNEDVEQDFISMV